MNERFLLYMEGKATLTLSIQIDKRPGANNLVGVECVSVCVSSRDEERRPLCLDTGVLG